MGHSPIDRGGGMGARMAWARATVHKNIFPIANQTAIRNTTDPLSLTDHHHKSDSYDASHRQRWYISFHPGSVAVLILE